MHVKALYSDLCEPSVQFGTPLNNMGRRQERTLQRGHPSHAKLPSLDNTEVSSFRKVPLCLIFCQARFDAGVFGRQPRGLPSR